MTKEQIDASLPELGDASPSPAVRTKYLGPTDTRGSRVKATHVNTGRSVTLGWLSELGAEENHERAARHVLHSDDGSERYDYSCHPLLCSAIKNGGYLFMVSR